jgi:hypothetical protein
MLNIKERERVAVVSAGLRGLSYQQMQQSFERKLRKPARTKAINRLLVN